MRVQRLYLLVGLLALLALPLQADTRHCGYIYGIHFWYNGANSIMNGKGGWTVESFQPEEWNWHTGQFSQAYGEGFTIIARLNYKGGETVPKTRAGLDEFKARCRTAVQNLNSYCHHWLIGNEMNCDWEGSIAASWYATVYHEVRQAIHEVQSNAVVIVGAIGPWNPGLGGWKQYTQDLRNALNSVDGIAIHCYGCREGTSKDPRNDGESGFQVYRYFTSTFDTKFPAVPYYITETNTAAGGIDPPWDPANSYDDFPDWMQAAFQEIDNWNAGHGRRIQCLCWFVYAPKDYPNSSQWMNFALISNDKCLPEARNDFAWTTSHTYYRNNH